MKRAIGVTLALGLLAYAGCSSQRDAVPIRAIAMSDGPGLCAPVEATGGDAGTEGRPATALCVAKDDASHRTRLALQVADDVRCVRVRNEAKGVGYADAEDDPSRAEIQVEPTGGQAVFLVDVHPGDLPSATTKDAGAVLLAPDGGARDAGVSTAVPPSPAASALGSVVAGIRGTLRIEAFRRACWQICAESRGALVIELRRGAGARAYPQSDDVACPYWGPRSQDFFEEAGVPLPDAGTAPHDESTPHDADAGHPGAAADGGKKDGGAAKPKPDAG